METEVLPADEESGMARAAELLRAGNIVALPTETVYGLGVRGDRPEGLERLRRLKERPAGKKFSRLICSPEDADAYGELGPAATVLAEQFWPGPLTLVVPDREGGYVGLRCPDCTVARELVRRTGTALATPSANISGRPPALTAEEVREAFAGRIAAVVDGGPAPMGQASTVVRVEEGRMELLRAGALEPERLRRALEETWSP